MTIKIVTDSTCDIPEVTADKLDITVVPVYVNIGNQSFLDGVELLRSDFYKRLPNYSSLPTTAAPAPGAFTETYDKLANKGATEILSIHLAASLSGLLNVARVGADATDKIKVNFFDSQQLSMGLGLLVITAAEAAKNDCSMDEIVDILNERLARTYVFAVLDTLEYLRRSGRVNWAQFGLGTLLRIKPLIRVHTGEVDIPERVRTMKKALAKMLSRVAELGTLESLALLHTHSADKLESFRQQSEFLNPGGVSPLAVEVTPAIGAHVGPGGLGIACITAK
jgi:DegV family protein with EDD domain